MNNNSLRKIKKVDDWFLYLKRSLDIFSFVSNAEAYKMIKYIGGIKNIGYLYNNNFVEYYRSEKEFSKNLELLQKNIINNPSKIEKELLKGLKYNKKAKGLIDKFKKDKKNNFNENKLADLIVFYTELFAYATVFPYLVGLSLEKIKNKNNKIIKIVNQLRLASHYLDFRLIVLEDLFSKVFKEKKVSFSNYTPKEILAFLKSGKIKKENRKFYYYFIIDEDRITGSDKKFFDYIKKTVATKSDDAKNQITGNIAFRGVARGYAKIIYNEKDFNKFNKNDILVTINSNPFLMPVIKKCKAIIADEGGMLSHAAIISRELKIPCIVGIKIATQVLHDGDLVEVDANEGVVRILKKS